VLRRSRARAEGRAHVALREIVNEAIDEVILGEAFKAETLASHIAERVRDRRRPPRRGHDRRALPRAQAGAGLRYADAGDLHAVRLGVASARGTRRLVGRPGPGHDRLPVRAGDGHERSRERLREDGFSDDEIARVFDAVPVATHNQRGIGTLHIGCPEACTEARRPAPCSRSSRPR